MAQDLVVEILPDVGGRLHRIVAFGHDLLRTPDDVATHRSEPFGWGCYPMVPWCNRIPDGRLSFGGRDVRLPVNLGRHAIHGEAYARPWSGDGVFEGGTFGWPWRYRATQAFTVAGPTLTLTIAVVNEDDDPMPAGVGFHPWFSNASPLSVALPAELTYPTDDCLPVGHPIVVSGDRDRRTLSPVPWGLDTVWTGLTSRQIDLDWPEWGIAAAYTFGPAASHVVMAAFADHNTVAIEPITHVPGGGPRAMTILQPGESLELQHTLTVTRR